MHDGQRPAHVLHAWAVFELLEQARGHRLGFVPVPGEDVQEHEVAGGDGLAEAVTQAPGQRQRAHELQVGSGLVPLHPEHAAVAEGVVGALDQFVALGDLQRRSQQRTGLVGTVVLQAHQALVDQGPALDLGQRQLLGEAQRRLQ